MGRWDEYEPDRDDRIPSDPWSQRWFIWGKNLDRVMDEIYAIDKESDYRRLRFILKHDENRGFDNPEELI